MQHRGMMVICTIWTTVFLLASVVSGIPVEEGFLQINKGGAALFRTIFIESNENLESRIKVRFACVEHFDWRRLSSER